MTRQTVELASVSHDPSSLSHALVCGMWTFPSSKISTVCAHPNVGRKQAATPDVYYIVFFHASFPLPRRCCCFTPFDSPANLTPSGSLAASHKTLLPPRPSAPETPPSCQLAAPAAREPAARAFIVRAPTERDEVLRVRAHRTQRVINRASKIWTKKKEKKRNS